MVGSITLDELLEQNAKRGDTRRSTVERLAGGFQDPGHTPAPDPAAYCPKGSRRFVVGNPGRPKGAVDRKPRMPRDVEGIIRQVYAGLVRYDKATMRPVPRQNGDGPAAHPAP